MATFKRVNGDYTVKTLNQSDVITLDTAAAVITGDLTVQGNATLAGNINADRIFYGNTAVEIPVPGGNVAVSVAGTANVAVFSSTELSVAGNITGNYFTGNGSLLTGIVATSLGVLPSLSVTGNIDTGNLRTAGEVSVAGTVTADHVTSDFTGSVFADDSTLIVDAIDNRIFTSLVQATGNITGGNVVTAGIVTALGNIVTSGTFVGNFAGNITGNLTVPGSNTQVIFNNDGIAAASSAFVFDSAANIVTVSGTVSATGNVTGGNIVSNSLVASDLSVTADTVAFVISGNVDLGTRYINRVASPLQAQDAATKQYVDDAVSTGITIHTPVRVETPTALTATYAQGGNVYTVTDTVAGNTVVFSTAANLQVNDQLWFSNSFQGIVANVAYFVVSAPNTSAAVLTTTYSGVPVSNITSASGLSESVRVNSGTGATLTNAGANAALTIDGITLAVSDRVLVYQQANAAHNGVYTVTNTGNATVAWIMTRSSDMNTYAPNDINGVDAGDYFFVQEGNTGEAESYVMTAPVGPLIIGYDNLVFTQFSASKAYQAGDGLTLSGTTFSVNVDNDTTAIVADTVVIKSGANLVTPNIGNATGNSLTLTGNGAISGVSVAVTANVSAGNVLTGGQVSATGNITGGNIVVTTGIITAGVGNIIGGNISASGNINGGNLTLSGPSGALSVPGNITGGNILTIGQISANGVVIGSFNGSIQGLQIDVTGRISATGNVLTGGIVSATGNVIAAAFVGSGAGLSNINGSAVVGTVPAASVAGTVTSNSQANITSVGTLTSLAVSGNISAGNVSVSTGTVTLGNVVNANGNGVGNIGSSSLYFNTVFAKATSAQYADLAELYAADRDYEPGTVLMLGGPCEVTVCDQAQDPRVVGVVSATPAHVMNSGLRAQYSAVVALSGRVPTRVVGPVRKGDMMVSAGHGRAQACSQPAMGTVIGKSVEDFDGAEGVIDVVVGRL